MSYRRYPGVLDNKLIQTIKLNSEPLLRKSSSRQISYLMQQKNSLNEVIKKLNEENQTLKTTFECFKADV